MVAYNLPIASPSHRTLHLPAVSRPLPLGWDAISRGGLDRIQSRYTWRIYASRLMTLTRVYSFWRHVTNLVGPAT